MVHVADIHHNTQGKKSQIGFVTERQMDGLTGRLQENLQLSALVHKQKELVIQLCIPWCNHFSFTNLSIKH